jgi:hypothetical protein
MKVFRYGKFYDYDETYGDKSWSDEQMFRASSLYATCRYLGYEEVLAYSLSYMYIINESVPETRYQEEYMSILSRISRE